MAAQSERALEVEDIIEDAREHFMHLGASKLVEGFDMAAALASYRRFLCACHATPPSGPWQLVKLLRSSLPPGMPALHLLLLSGLVHKLSSRMWTDSSDDDDSSAVNTVSGAGGAAASGDGTAMANAPANPLVIKLLLQPHAAVVIMPSCAIVCARLRSYPCIYGCTSMCTMHFRMRSIPSSLVPDANHPLTYPTADTHIHRL